MMAIPVMATAVPALASRNLYTTAQVVQIWVRVAECTPVGITFMNLLLMKSVMMGIHSTLTAAPPLELLKTAGAALPRLLPALLCAEICLESLRRYAMTVIVVMAKADLTTALV